MLTPPSPQSLQQSALLQARARELGQAGQRQAAVDTYRQAIAACPASSGPYQGLVALLLQAGDLGNAIKVMNAVPAPVYRTAPGLQHLHAAILIHLGQLDGAIALLERLVGAEGVGQGSVHHNLAACHDRLERHALACACFERAQAAGKDDADLYLGWGGSLHKLGDVANARRRYEEGLRKFPGHSELPYELAVLLLKAGDFAEGFERYAHRWGARVFAQNRRPALALPAWDGHAPVRSLLVMAEQGIGDQIVFSALLPALMRRVEQVHVAPDPRLRPLLQRSWPGLLLADAPEGLAAEALRSRYDAWIPMGDLGRLAPEGIGWTGGPLRADPARVAALRERYRQQFPGKRLVGLSWKSQRAAFGQKKSIGLADWGPVLQQPDCQFVSLQYGDVAADVAQARAQLGVEVHVDPAIDAFADLDGLAAQMAALDQVISTSNTTAHLAAAQGLPTWVLVPMGEALLWYWGFGERAPWYPDARLFRLQAPGQWAPVIEAVAAALALPPGRG